MSVITPIRKEHMRLLTTSDFDGLACAVLLAEKGIVDEFEFIHPADIEGSVVDVSRNDIMANLPYVQECALWFDHHQHDNERLRSKGIEVEAISKPAASAAQVIWEYYGGPEFFSGHLKPLIEAVNISDTASYTPYEVLNSSGWPLFSFILDPRTGLASIDDHDAKNYQFMLDLIDFCRLNSVEEILEMRDVKQRVDKYFEHQKPYKQLIRKNSELIENLIVTSLLDQEIIYCGNRFIVYALYPDQNMDIRISRGRDAENVRIACGHSIFNRSCRSNLGKLMLKYGGGGHTMAAGCEVPLGDWELVVEEVIAATVQ
jgi:oligoribonuclease NrnB/cAMP/cGMP phosphodiesterase (DHH superfamily)